MDALIQAAVRVRENAFAPYSNFRVGAALETAGGEIITGCNVENASYGLTMCAERTAIFKAVSEGHRPHSFQRVVVCTDAVELTPPCGACRQILWEFCGDVPVILVNLKGKRREFQLRELFPEAFDAANLSE
ncbi:MAG: cytidine deaminase [Acidobacteria bacterium]|nr:cytidine deaminase [Acidobacteriota bacterium]